MHRFSELAVIRAPSLRWQPCHPRYCFQLEMTAELFYGIRTDLGTLNSSAVMAHLFDVWRR